MRAFNQRQDAGRFPWRPGLAALDFGGAHQGRGGELLLSGLGGGFGEQTLQVGTGGIERNKAARGLDRSRQVVFLAEECGGKLIAGSGFFGLGLFQEPSKIHQPFRLLGPDFHQLAEYQDGFGDIAFVAHPLEQVDVALLSFGLLPQTQIELRNYFDHLFVARLGRECQQILLDSLFQFSLLDQLFGFCDVLGEIVQTPHSIGPSNN